MSNQTSSSFNPAKVLRIAGREFASTALTKGFLIGAIGVPAFFLAMMPLIGILLNQATPPAEAGTLTIVDRSGAVTELFTQRVSQEAIAERRAADMAQATEQVKDIVGDQLAGQIEGQMQSAQSQAALQQAMGEVPKINVAVPDPEASDPDALLESVRASLTADYAKTDPSRPLGVLTIAEDAVIKPAARDTFGGYEIQVRPNLDDRTVSEIRRAARWAILEARYAANGQDRHAISALTTVVAGNTQEITETGTREASFELQLLLPGAFMILIMMGVLTGGQYLLTTTIEEKSSRVVEILLSATSSMELMTGKILGQMGVGLALTAMYSALGIAALLFFALADLISVTDLLAMIVFFILAYFMFGGLMAAIGASVNELREAQSLMTPVIMLTFIPYVLFLPISRDPNAIYSVVLSFLPPVSPFVMMLRVASSEPPPLWEVLASIGVSVLGCVVAVWLAAKIFRVGLLMYGKPPNFATLIKWIRMA
ncbi:MAG: ABC transporter permease [Planctomycetota bacterium]